MNLKHLTDEALHSDTHRWNRNCNQSLVTLLHHLLENERRRLFSKYKYSSLSDYVRGEFHYSEPEANRRIGAMRLMKEIPEISKQIASGELCMTNMNVARALFAKEKQAGRAYSREQKRELLSQISKKSTPRRQKNARQDKP